MVDQPFDRDPVEVLAAEFIERLRLGENPTVEEYAAMHPELADEIRDLFPTIATMEGLKLSKEANSGRTSLGTLKLKQLGDFRIIRELGRGGMGIVYEARQESLERTVAVKVLPKLTLLDSKHLQRFQREARTAANLHHSNIVPVFGVGHQDDFHYYAMQYIEGAGLDRVLNRLESSEAITQKSDITTIVRELATTVGSANETQVEGVRLDPLSVPLSFDTASEPTKSFSNDPAATPSAIEPLQSSKEARLPSATNQTNIRDASYWKTITQIGIQVAEALEYAHGKGVLHRDIKPANLIIDTQGVVWVADFGLAKALENDQLSRTGDVLGTPAYMAPEQLRGQTDLRSDIYSLGITLYELLTLRSAFPETNRSRLFERIANEEPVRPRQVRPDIPRDLETIVMKATAHEPKRRYQSAGELAVDLHRFLEDRPIQARRSSNVERLWRWCRRNPVVAGLSMAAVLLLLLVAITATIGYVHTTRALAAEQAQRQRAEAQRQRAETATSLALQALDRIYERFAPPSIGKEYKNEIADGSTGSRKMRPVLSEGTAVVLDELLVFYDRLAEEGGNDNEYLEEIALANRRIGDIRHNLGQLQQAKKAYERAIELYGQLDDSSPDKPCLFDEALLYIELGIIYDRSQDHEKAFELWKTSLDMLEKLETKEPENQKIRLAISRARNFLNRKNENRRMPLSPTGQRPLNSELLPPSPYPPPF